MPFTSYYFCSAVVLLLQLVKLPVWGFLIGRLVLVLMKHICKEHQEAKIKIPGLRFAMYQKVVLPKKEGWVTSCKEVCQLCLNASFQINPPGDKKERALVHKKTRKLIAEQIPDVGSLVSNHLMSVLAIVSLVPTGFAEEHTIDATSKSITFLVKNKGLAKGKPAAQ